ncbi:MAG: sulfatase-like hydrolase/transferase [Acholeplasmataceae bacterium]
MKQHNEKNIYYIFIGIYFLLNITNTYFLTTQTLNKYIAPFEHTFFGELNAVIGNAAILLLFLAIGQIVFRKMKHRMVYLTSITFVYNIFIFAFGAFTLFFGASFSIQALSIFYNPAGGFAGSTAIEIFNELIYYYRIVVFVPSFILLGVTIWASVKKLNLGYFNFSIKKYVISVLGVMLLWFSTSSLFIQRFMEDLPVESTISSYASQNYGIYPYYLGTLLGFDYSVQLEDILEINTQDDLANAYQVYNKNQDSYVNYFNQEIYSNILTTSQTTQDLYIDPSISKGTEVNGILEGKNIVLVHLESLNYFLLEFMQSEAVKGNSEILEEAVTFMNNIFEQSFVFENFYNNVGMGVSSDAELAVLTGLNATGNKTLYWDYDETPYDFDSLASYFDAEDYYMEAIHGDSADFYNRGVVYKDMYGFDTYYHIDDFIADGANIEHGYLYNQAEGLYHISPWISDYELADYVYEAGNQLNAPYFLYPITMMGHTPFDFGPYEDLNMYPDYSDDIHDITERYLNYGPYYLNIIKRFFLGDGNTDQTLDNTVYIFYSDHGSDLKSGDISNITNQSYSVLNERQMLQHIISFIYVPSDDTYVDYGDYQLRKGLLTGTQPLVRSEIDLYRTIIELFNLDATGDLYFGVNGLSDEPTFALDNRVEDVVLDNYIYSMRNIQNVYPYSASVDQNIYDYILRYKLLSDYLLSTATMQNNIKEAIANVYG